MRSIQRRSNGFVKRNGLVTAAARTAVVGLANSLGSVARFSSSPASASASPAATPGASGPVIKMEVENGVAVVTFDNPAEKVRAVREHLTSLGVSFVL
jgi:hypothetical protein